MNLLLLNPYPQYKKQSRYLQSESGKEREKIAGRYLKEIKNSKLILPTTTEGATHVWHQFVIRCEKRSELIDYLDKEDIGTIIHYPIPPHLSEAYAPLGYHTGDYPITENYADTVLSLPMYNGMTDDEQTRVITALNNF